MRLSRQSVSRCLNIIGRPEGVALPEIMNEVQAQAEEKMLQVKKMNNSRNMNCELWHNERVRR